MNSTINTPDAAIDAAIDTPETTLDVAQDAYIKASNTGAADEFGVSVALSTDGSTLAVCADIEASGTTDQDDNSALGAGAVYIFVRVDDAWAQQAYLKAPMPGVDDRFCRYVSISGDGSTLAVGADFEDSGSRTINGNQADNTAMDAGAVYIFTRSGTTWTSQAYLKASNAEAGDRFGSFVSLSRDGDTLAVGATNEDGSATGVSAEASADNSAASAGAAYVFTRVGVTWTQQAYLKASNTEAGDSFGRVALSADGQTLAVGAGGEDSAAVGVNGMESNNSAPLSGAVYVFARAGNSWSQQAYVKASNTDDNDDFGFVALSGDGSTLVVGAQREASSGQGVGANQADNLAPIAGAAYVFRREGTTWIQESYLKASNAEANDEFGEAIAISDDGSIIAIGASTEDSAAVGIGGNEDDGTAAGSGAAYVFLRDDGLWSQRSYVKSSNTNSGDLFGFSLALAGDGSTIAVGAFREDSAATGVNGQESDNSSSNSGAVYTFRTRPRR